jgi:internalin A
MASTRRIRFGIKSLLLATAALCFLLALVAQPMVEVRRQQQLIDELIARGFKTSSRGTIMRERSLGRIVLGLFSTSYDRDQLYGLDVSGTKFTDDDLAALTQVHHVNELNLAGTQITNAGIRHLQSMEYLTKLDVSDTRLTDEGVKGLSSLENLSSLRAMGTEITYEALEALDEALPHAHFCEERAIEELKAAGIQVVDHRRISEGDDPWNWIIDSGNEAVMVIVGMNQKLTLTPDHVLRLNYLQSLRDMTFHTVTLAPGGLQGLQQLEELKKLEFWFVNLTDKDIEALARQTQLESLMIYEADSITDECLKRLAALKKLRKLRIAACNQITHEAIAALTDELPECDIMFSQY